MLVKLFRPTRPEALLFIPFLVLLLWIQTFFEELTVQHISHPMPLYKFIKDLLENQYFILQPLIAIILICVEALFFNYIISKHEVLNKQTNIPALIYCLFMSFSPSLLFLHPIIFVNGIFLIITDNMLSLYKSTKPFKQVFDIGFLIGISAFLFYFPSILLIILVWLSLLILRPFAWREWVISLIGLLLSLFFISIYYFWNDKLYEFWRDNIMNKFFWKYSTKFSLETFETVLIVFFILLVLLSFIKLLLNFYKNITRHRNYQKLMLSFIIISFLAILCSINIYAYHFSVLAIPVSVFISHYFIVTKKNWWVETLFLMLLGGIISTRFLF